MAEADAVLPSPASHRLPTVSASQALQTFQARGSRTVSTGLTQLDKILCLPSLPSHDISGGYVRGKVTEIYGPSGSGKTAFGIQAAVSALREDQHVVWIDAACAPLVKRRLGNIFSGIASTQVETSGPTSKPGIDEANRHFHYTATPTLAHLLALFMHSPATFPPNNTSLVVIDSIATLIDNAYPRNIDERTRNKSEQSRWAAGRRFPVVNDLIAALTKFAALHDIALLLTCQTITRIRGLSRALLVPAISGVEWENGISTRLVLFRDWVRQAKTKDAANVERLQRARFVGLVKASGVALADEGGTGSIVPFTIEDSGLCDISIVADDLVTPVIQPSHLRPRKRPFEEVEEGPGGEPNSDELYGWIEDDEVAAEGLLIDEGPVIDDSDISMTRFNLVADRHNKKVARTSTT
ncbi:hypothetical protein ACN47E_006945 [Coniothyrium glycines]